MAITNLPDHVSVASVTADGVPVDPVGGVYTVDSGASVVVTFAADPGYALAGAPTRAIMPFEGPELPVESVPAAVRPNDLVRINEIMASNPSPDKGGLVSELGIAEMDWIELYNGYSQDIDATGWFLSDNAKPGKETKATILGSCVIPAGGYKIVWLDKIHTNAVEYAADEAFAVLKLSSDGDLIQIADAGTNVIQKIDFQTQRQIKGFSYGPLSVRSGADLVPGDGPCVYMRNATPGAPNVTQGWGDFTPAVTFSEPHGWKTAPFELELSCSDPEASIYYTLDGTPPTATSFLYTNAIPVSKTTVVRAAVPDESSILQIDASATYLFLDDILAQGRSTAAPEGAVGFPDSQTVVNIHGKKQKMLYGMNQTIVANNRARILAGFTNSIPTISLVVDPENLFDGSTGIYVNPRGEGREWERQTMLEIFDPKGVAANVAQRVSYMQQQYQKAGWYPTNQPPRFVDARGEPFADGDVVPDGEKVFLAGLGEGTNIWYTLDGSDPLDLDGQPAATAVAYTSEGFALTAQFTTIRARSVALGEASALAEIDLEQEPEAPSDLMLGIRVAGIMNACAGDGDSDDFIILTNLLDRAVSLADLRIVSMSTGDPESKASVAFTLGETSIAANGTMKLMANPWWFDKPQPASASKTCKLKNGDIDVKLFDTNRVALVQTATVSGNWWPVGTGADGKVKYACKQTGAHFVAKVFDRNPVVQDDWRPSFMPPLASSAGFEGVTAAAVDPDVKAWLDELGSTESGQAAITAFAGTAKALDSCYLSNVDPLTEGVVLSISGFAFTNGEARIDGTLTTNGTPLEAGHRVRGNVRLYYSGSVTNLDDATDFVEVDPPSFPVEATNEVSGAEIPAARFYRLKIER